jgi:hypothetical protein
MCTSSYSSTAKDRAVDDIDLPVSQGEIWLAFALLTGGTLTMAGSTRRGLASVETAAAA